MPCYWKCWSSSQEWLLASRATLSDQSLNINLTRPLQCLEPLEQVKKWQNSNDLILSVKNVNLRLKNTWIQFREAGCHSGQIEGCTEPNDSLLGLFALITELCPRLSDSTVRLIPTTDLLRVHFPVNCWMQNYFQTFVGNIEVRRWENILVH